MSHETKKAKGTKRVSHEPAVSFRNVSFAYDRVPVLRDVSFSVGEREAICIVGPNGGGKTTLAKLILGLQNIR